MCFVGASAMLVMIGIVVHSIGLIGLSFQPFLMVAHHKDNNVTNFVA